jgi:hypothetical protein
VHSLEAAGRTDAGSVAIELQIAGQLRRSYYRTSATLPDSAADTVLAVSLPVAMRLGLALHVTGAVSPRLLNGARTIQAIFSTWSRHYRRVPITAELRATSGAADRAVACFFSGGVDSFHTLLTNREPITHLIFVHGFDLPLASTRLRAQAVDTARTVADELGLELVEAETDIHDLTDEHVHWGLMHGPALASAGLLLQEHFARILIPATHTYADLLPWGSHPLVDPLWSTERTEFVHCGAEATRIEKCRVVGQSDVAMARLRVCSMWPTDLYNCGECEKCLRTMINLKVAGALDRCQTLPHRIDPDAVATTTLRDANDRAFAAENLAALEASGSDPDLCDALRESLSRAGGTSWHS